MALKDIFEIEKTSMDSCHSENNTLLKCIGPENTKIYFLKLGKRNIAVALSDTM